ncbi:unnamed protein product [Caretta caretta]
MTNAETMPKRKHRTHGDLYGAMRNRKAVFPKNGASSTHRDRESELHQFPLYSHLSFGMCMFKRKYLRHEMEVPALLLTSTV